MKKVYFFVAAASLLSCGTKFKKFYVIDVPRVAVAQVLNVPNNDLSACTAHPYCLQFPARPSQNMQVRFVAISPASEAVQLDIVSVVSQREALVGGSARSNLGGGGQGAYCAAADSTLVLTKNTLLSSVKQQTPMRIEEFVYDVAQVSWAQLVTTLLTKQCSPVFRINYKAVSASGDDKGFLSVFMLPDPSDATAWTFFQTQAAQAGVSNAEAAAFTAHYKALAKTNVPPKVDNLTPSDGKTIATGENILEVTLDKTADADDGARRRVGWFVSKGELNFQNKASVKWEPQAAGDVSAFVMVRDLQGGAVYRFAKYTAQ